MAFTTDDETCKLACGWTCPACGENDLVHELRNALPENEAIPPPEAYGHWIVCDSCGWEQAGDDEEPEQPQRQKRGPNSG